MLSLSKISDEQIKLNAQISADDTFQIFKATMMTPDGASKEVLVRKYYPSESLSFDNLIKSTSIIQKYAKEFYVPIVGVNENPKDKQKYTVSESMVLLDNVIDDQRKVAEANEKKDAVKKPLPLDEVTRIRIMYDVARYIEAISKVADSKDSKENTVMLKREIISDNVFLRKGYLEQKTDPKKMDVAPPPIAFVGENGGPEGTLRSRTIGGKTRDYYNHPPYSKTDNPKLDIEKMIWQWGILAFEIWTGAQFEKFTEEDRERFIMKRFKPKNDNMANIYNNRWMAQPDKGGIPNVLYEAVQVVCWNHALDRRPKPQELVQIVKWAYMNALAGIFNDDKENEVCEIIMKKKAIAPDPNLPSGKCGPNSEAVPQDPFIAFLKICKVKEDDTKRKQDLKKEFDDARQYEDWVERLWQIKHPAHAHLYTPSDKKIAETANRQTSAAAQDVKDVKEVKSVVKPQEGSPQEVKLKPDALSVLNNLIKEILPDDLFQFVLDQNENCYRLNLGAALMLPGVKSKGLASHFVSGMKQIGIPAVAKITQGNEMVDIRCVDVDSAKIDLGQAKKALTEFVAPFKEMTADLYYTCGNLAATNDIQTALKMWHKAKMLGHDAAAVNLRIPGGMPISGQQRSGKLF